jgi:hypothetical protein
LFKTDHYTGLVQIVAMLMKTLPGAVDALIDELVAIAVNNFVTKATQPCPTEKPKLRRPAASEVPQTSPLKPSVLARSKVSLAACHRVQEKS